jgi:2-polyprenyl-3-methyl-5-hydroxy-6-metoxy-1,4-benzoquinol methylase
MSDQPDAAAQAAGSAGVPLLEKLDARIPSWDHAALQPRRCPFCDVAGNDSFVRPDGLTIKHCESCDASFVSPAPSEAQLQIFYEHYNDAHRVGPKVSDEYFRKLFANVDPYDTVITKVLSQLVDLNGRSCLDVGFGTGRYLAKMAALGCGVSGLELDRDVIAYVNKYLGIGSCRYGTIFDLGREETFDVMLMIDLVEHPLDPLAVLKRAKEHLNPGGLLVVRTPNGTSAMLERDPVQFRVDLEHMQYVSNSTCNYVARTVGFDVVHLEDYGYPDLWGMGAPRDAAGGPGTGPAGAGAAVAARAKQAIKRLPFFTTVNTIRTRLLPGHNRDERLGRYHLLCVFQNR